LTYTLHVTNAAYLTDTLRVSMAGQTWPTSLSTTVITLPGGLSAEFVVSVTVPPMAAVPSLPPGSEDSVRVIVAPQGSTLQAASVLTSSVRSAYDFALQAQATQQGGDPGAIVNYPLSVANTGSLTDTIELTISGHAWPAAATPSSVWLPPYSSTQVVVATTIPNAVLAGVQDTIIVTATSQAGLLTRTMAFTTTANAQYGVSLSPGAAQQTGRPGAEVVYTLTITNTGNITDSFALSQGGSRWPVSVPAMIPALPAWTGASFAVTVTLPTTWQTPSETVILTATSQGGGAPVGAGTPVGAPFAVARLTTTVEAYRVYLPVLLR
jgi:hypothetical protein